MHSKIDTSTTLRQVRPHDLGVLCAPYASTRSEEMSLLQWPEAEKNAFLNLQFHVERFNPALHLYPRLGFRLFEDKSMYSLTKESIRGEQHE